MNIFGHFLTIVADIIVVHVLKFAHIDPSKLASLSFRSSLVDFQL